MNFKDHDNDKVVDPRCRAMGINAPGEKCA